MPPVPKACTCSAALVLLAVLNESASIDKTVRGRIVIGGAVQLSGKFGKYGEQAVNIAQLWKEAVDEDPGFPFEVVFRWEDDQSSEATAVQKDKDMLEPRTVDSPDVLICPYTSVSSIAVCNMLDDNNISVLCGVWGGASESIFDYPKEGKGLNLRVQSFSVASNYMTEGLEHAYAELTSSSVSRNSSSSDAPRPKAAFIYANSDAFSKSVCEGAIVRAEEMGFEVSQDTIIDPFIDPSSGEETIYQTFMDELSRVPFVDLYDVTRYALDPLVDAEKLADVLVSCGLYDAQTAVVFGLIARRIRPKFTLMTNAADSKLMSNALPINMLDVFMPTQWAPSMPGQDEVFGDSYGFYHKYKSRFASSVTYHGASFGGFLTMLARALKESADTANCDNDTGECELNAAALRASFRSPAVEKGTFYGLVDVNEYGMNENKPMLQLQIQMGEGGAFVFVPAAPASKIPAAWVGANFPRWPARSWSQVSTDFFNSYCGGPGLFLPDFEVLKVVGGVPRADYGTFSYPRTGDCEQCPRGTSRPLNFALCYECSPGTAAPNLGQAECDLCPEGSAMAHAGASECESCQPGKVAGEKGLKTCHLCERGKFMDKDGQAECLNCPIGKYQNETGKSECVPCTDAAGMAMTTHFAGAFEKEMCVCTGSSWADDSGRCQECPAGMLYSATMPKDFPCVCTTGRFWGAKAHACLACPAGMRCEAGRGKPMVEPGFWAHASDDEDQHYSVYRCINTAQCPGGPAGTCAAGRDPEQMGCARCKAGYVVEGNGDVCNECNASDFVPVAITILVCIASLGAIAYFANMDVANSKLNTIIMLVVLGQMVVVIQWMSVLNSLTLEWVEPFKTVLKLASIFSFDIEALKAGCLLPESSALLLFLLRLLMFPAAAAVLVAMMWCHSRVQRRKLHWNQVVNSLGTILVVLYLSLTILSLTPFVCIDSPNGTQSMASNPSVICGDNSTFVWLASFGVSGLLGYSVTPIAIVVFVSIRYPAMVAKGNANVIMSRFRFLFQRFAVKRYYYAPIYMLRNFLIALTPVVLANHDHIQVITLGALFVQFSLASAYFRPWRGRLTNLLEITFMGLFIITLIAAGLLIDVDRKLVLRDMQVVLSAILVGLAIPVLVLCVFFLYYRWNPKKKYSAFLSHHKLGMAVGCRLLKMELARHLPGKVFLDSDELDDLDGILDIVRVGTQRLVVLLTTETLWRPWCAGEIATAHANKVPIICVACDGYTEPADEELEVNALAHRWTVQDFAPMALRGVTFSGLRGAYLALRDRAKLQWKRAQMALGGLHSFSPDFVNTLVELCTKSGASILMADDAGVANGTINTGQASQGWSESLGPAKKLRRMGKDNSLPSNNNRQSKANAEILVIANGEDGEAISGAQVIARLLQSQTQKTAMEAFVEEEIAAYRQPQVLVVSLTKGAFQSHAFARTVVTAWKYWEHMLEIVTVRSLDFQFPLRETLDRCVFPQLAEACCVSVENVTAAFGSILSSLAMPFFPSCNEHLLFAEVKEVAGRINRVVGAKRSSTRGSASSSLLEDQKSGFVSEAASIAPPQHEEMTSEEVAGADCQSNDVFDIDDYEEAIVRKESGSS